MASIFEQVGLLAINAIARSAPYVVETLAYGDDDRQRFDWYRLPGDESRPTIIFFYGGNWRSGRRGDYRFVADTLATLGCDVVVPDYRLFPSVRFDEILSDAVRAAKLALDRIDLECPVLLMGHSAGAQVSALLTLNGALLTHRERISGMIGLAGPYDFYPFTEDDHWDLFGPEERYPASQPVNYVRADAPPLYLLHGRRDQRVRRGHSKSLMEKQRAAGGVAEREVYENLDHIGILLEFVRTRRRHSPVVADVRAFVESVAGASG